MICIVISGPTASGKSSLALALSKKYDGWIINADSQQILEELPILTDQPVNASNTFLYGHKKHTQYYSSFQWCLEAGELVHKSLELRKIPILVGGTGFYLNNFLTGHLDDSGRIFFIKGIPVFKILINPPKDELEEKCKTRINQMFPQVTEEVQNCPDHPRLRKVIGFSEIKDGVDLVAIQDKMLIRTRQYIKRQKTWFKKYCSDWNQDLDQLRVNLDEWIKDNRNCR